MAKSPRSRLRIVTGGRALAGLALVTIVWAIVFGWITKSIILGLADAGAVCVILLVASGGLRGKFYGLGSGRDPHEDKE